MKVFNFFKDKKVTVWEREIYNIEAETQKEALDILLDAVENITDWELNPQLETLYETSSDMSLEENNYNSTLEVIDNETSETIYRNGN